MKEKLYTIPVNEAYDSGHECPLCYIKETLERQAIEYTMGPSYMEDDVRAVTDKIGFCSNHVGLLYQDQNRLGLALMLKTHMDKVIDTIEDLTAKSPKSSKSFTGLFNKKKDKDPLVSYINELEESCFICNKINNTFDRYINTIFVLYKSDDSFRKKTSQIKGYCTDHYGLLYELAPNFLKGEYLDSFISDLNKVYLENIKRVRDDLDWFIDKFDYRYKDAPWKNSKDALPRSIIKTNGKNVNTN
ncbi:MAG: hypothetical protein GX323_05815 [Clostridiales bacterium]|nr:hypothetical protein [Clostridiales bacterium]